MSSSPSLSDVAKKAAANHVDSDVECAIEFCQNVPGLSDFCSTSNDRLVKLARRLRCAIEMDGTSSIADTPTVDLEAALGLLVQEAEILLKISLSSSTTKNESPFKVPTVPFGDTGLEMPIVTLGCMRFQQEWGPRITNMNQVDSDCQDNLVAILKTAILDYGIKHIETARGYGCSELQIGAALKQLMAAKLITRDDFILQTKVAPNADTLVFRKELETSFKNLQVDYIDLFAFHGINMPEQLTQVVGDDDNSNDTCLAVIKEYQAAGKIKHIGFSTHASTDLILKSINTDVFDYVNLHHHYFGSYTATGCGSDGQGNLDCIKLLNEKKMGVFIISPYDKGGRLYAPSKQLYSLTLPEMEPMIFKSQWIWNHHNLYSNGDADNDVKLHMHTFTVGAGRPSDLDQPAVAAYLHATKQEETLQKLKTVTKRLDDWYVQSLGGQDWTNTWWKGLTKAADNKHSVEHNQIVWLYNSIKAFGLLDFAKNRYGAFESNLAKWDDSLPTDENIDNVGRRGWGFVPGISLRDNIDYSEDLVKVPSENMQRVLEAEAFVKKWCAKPSKKVNHDNDETIEVHIFNQTFSVSTKLLHLPQMVLEHLSQLDIMKQFQSQQAALKEDDKKEDEQEPCPKGWETAFDLRPWPDYPDRPSRAN